MTVMKGDDGVAFFFFICPVRENDFMHFIASANREAIGLISTFLGRVNPMFVEIEQRKKMSSVEKTSSAKTNGGKKCWSPRLREYRFLVGSAAVLWKKTVVVCENNRKSNA